MVEILVAMALLTFIVLALMTVFSNTQRAFRANLTQTDSLESGRAVMDLMAGDLAQAIPSYGTNGGANGGVVNFYVFAYNNYPSLIQSFVGSGQQRINVLANFFILSRQNVTWYGTGYAVLTNSPDGTSLYPLYRFSTNYPVMNTDPARLFTDFQNFLFTPTNGSHLMDGVVDLRVHAFDPNGNWQNWTNSQNRIVSTNNITFFQTPDETGLYMYSNVVPAAVEIELGTLEDRTLQRAASLSLNPVAQANYLAGHVGQVHVFRQRVPIRNVDPSAYQ